MIEEKPIEHCEIGGDISVKELVKELHKSSFGAKDLANAADIFKEMCGDDDCVKFAALSGALVPGGMRDIIHSLLDHIDALITTGAMLTHDLIEAFGGKHICGSLDIRDEELHEKAISRIHTTYLPTSGFETFEKSIRYYLSQLDQKTYSASDLMEELGKIIEEKSVIKLAYEKGVRIFCPAIADSVLGLQTWIMSQDHNIEVNPILDQKRILDMIWNGRRVGALIVGGGTPKHYVAMSAQATEKGLSYGVQITMDRPEHGGVSGAPLKEGISWGKVEKNAKVCNLICDATIALPILVAYIK